LILLRIQNCPGQLSFGCLHSSFENHCEYFVSLFFWIDGEDIGPSKENMILKI
jgi:hypothetical protein